jgi:nucleotide-binding universal stress UspA family protein
VDVHIYEGDPATTIIDHVRDERVDLVALASHGRTGVTGAELGAVALKTILGIHVPLLLVRAFGAGRRDADATRYRKVLVALDGSRRAECALPVVHRIADEHGAALLLGHVVREPEVPHRLPLGQDEQAVVDGLGALARRHATAYLDALRDDLAGAGRSVSVHVLSGNDPVTELEAFAEHEDVDLILMSAHGATGTTRRPFGAIAEKFVLYGSRPILIVQDRSRDEIEASPARAAARQRAGHS